MVKRTTKSKSTNQVPKVVRPAQVVVPGPTKLRYQKLTGGLHYMGDGTKVVKNQIITVYPEQISGTFKSDFKCLDVDPTGTDIGLKIGLQPVKDKFNIINIKTGEVINKGKPLTAAQAKIFMGENEELPKEAKEEEEEDEEEEEEEFDDD